jgi:hypothetical protein
MTDSCCQSRCEISTAPIDGTTLQVPDWVPASVKEQALLAWAHWSQVLSTGFPEFEAVTRFRRLVCDQRMRKVWKELLRRKRDGSGFVNPAWGRSDLQSERNQQETLQWFFILVVTHLSPDIVVRTRAEVETERAQLFDAVKKLHAIARNILPLAPFNSEEIELAAKSLSSELEKGSPSRVISPLEYLTVERRRGDSRLRAFVLATADICNRQFGRSLYSTVATITNVVFGRQDVTAIRVREIVRD